jgi:hypothetical protein
MACSTTSEFWQNRLTTTLALIAAYDAALLALGEGGVQSYSLDDGQTRVTKTRFDIASLGRTRDRLLNELAVLEVRLGCSRGSSYAGPSF